VFPQRAAGLAAGGDVARGEQHEQDVRLGGQCGLARHEQVLGEGRALHAVAEHLRAAGQALQLALQVFCQAGHGRGIQRNGQRAAHHADAKRRSALDGVIRMAGVPALGVDGEGGAGVCLVALAAWAVLTGLVAQHAIHKGQGGCALRGLGEAAQQLGQAQGEDQQRQGQQQGDEGAGSGRAHGGGSALRV